MWTRWIKGRSCWSLQWNCSAFKGCVSLVCHGIGFPASGH